MTVFLMVFFFTTTAEGSWDCTPSKMNTVLSHLGAGTSSPSSAGDPSAL